jgi:hypothetical protein
MVVMKNVFANIDVRQILTVLFVSALSLGGGFLVGMWLGS